MVCKTLGKIIPSCGVKAGDSRRRPVVTVRIIKRLKFLKMELPN